MATRRINGIELEKMIKNGAAFLQQYEDEVNRLNVFPVPDGDTGTNMVLTLDNGIRNAVSADESGRYLESLAGGMLLGARGNSGVILAQFFSGFATQLKNTESVGPEDLCAGLVKGYQSAYDAVLHPVEGTILSVTREGIENIRTKINRYTSIEGILSMYTDEMRKSLSYTPEMLPVLKEAGVVDSGAYGFILIIEGMLQYLNGEIKTYREVDLPENTHVVNAMSLFDENSQFLYGYCTEFILQLLRSPQYRQDFDKTAFISALESFGDSLVVVLEGSRVKVHIHTLKPSDVIAYSQQYGEFLTFKMDNMQIQHNEYIRTCESVKSKPLAVVAVANGDGMKHLFKDFGCDVVLDGGPTMNTSVNEFVNAYNELNAGSIVVLPNNPDIIPAANQALEISGRENVYVFDTVNLLQGYFALAMDIPDSDDVEFRIDQMKSVISDITAVSQTVASNSYTYNDVVCTKGDEIAFVDGKLISAGNDFADAIISAMSSVDDIDEKETCVIFRGKDVSEDLEDKLENAITEKWPLLECEFVYGGQDVYHWLLGLM